MLITDPSVAFVLISLGTLGITWELINPGSVFPGVIGAIFLLMGFLALGTLPVNWGGAVFMVLAFVMFIADVFLPTHGILTAGGIASLTLGGLLLVNTAAAPGVPSGVALRGDGYGDGAWSLLLLRDIKVVQARRRRPSTGRENLLGSVGARAPTSRLRAWCSWRASFGSASSDNGSIPAGQPVKVVGADGLKLTVVAGGRRSA